MSKRTDLVQALIAAGRRLDDLGLVPARDGNLSARWGENRLLITATGARARALTEDSVVEVDMSGDVVHGGTPSAETGLHRAIYVLRPDAHAVIHAHPPKASGFACAGLALTEPLMPEAVVHLGPVPLTPYATPGTPELEAAVADAARHHDGFLLANHGAVTLGASVEEALDRMEILEHVAHITLVANLLGGSKRLGSAELAALEALRSR
jgi:L-fuculose-phosphate aldolase